MYYVLAILACALGIWFHPSAALGLMLFAIYLSIEEKSK